MNNVNTTVATGSAKNTVMRGLALGATLVAVTGGAARAQPAAHTPSQTVVSEAGGARTPEPNTSDDKTVVTPRAPIARPAQAPVAAPVAPAPAVAQAQSDDAKAYVELVKGTLGWIELPDGVVGYKTNAAYAASMQGSLGWIDAPANLAGFQDEQAFTNAMTASFGWPDAH